MSATLRPRKSAGTLALAAIHSRRKNHFFIIIFFLILLLIFHSLFLHFFLLFIIRDTMTRRLTEMIAATVLSAANDSAAPIGNFGASNVSGHVFSEANDGHGDGARRARLLHDLDSFFGGLQRVLQTE